MALLQDLIKQVDDPELRERILMEVNKLNKQKKFGLVLRNICRNVLLYMTSGSNVAQKLRSKQAKLMIFI